MAAESAHIAVGGTHARTVGRTALSGGKMISFRMKIDKRL